MPNSIHSTWSKFKKGTSITVQYDSRYLILIALEGSYIFKSEGPGLVPVGTAIGSVKNKIHHCSDANQKATVNQGVSDPLHSLTQVGRGCATLHV